MIYFANPTGSAINCMLDGRLGYIDTPLQGNKRPAGVVWCADNGCFNDATFDEDRWWRWLEKNAVDAATCKFATAPDVMGDHAATLIRSRPWLPKIRQLGYPAAFVAQDWATPETMPWDEFDALFVGGTTEFKLGPQARAVIIEAKKRGMWVHAGRVNSRRRYQHFAAPIIADDGETILGGCDSCDGTYLVFGPDINLPKLLSWIEDHHRTPDLFTMED